MSCIYVLQAIKSSLCFCCIGWVLTTDVESNLPSCLLDKEIHTSKHINSLSQSLRHKMWSSMVLLQSIPTNHKLEPDDEIQAFPWSPYDCFPWLEPSHQPKRAVNHRKKRCGSAPRGGSRWRLLDGRPSCPGGGDVRAKFPL